ncbi:caspase family protein [Aquibium sp. ELW1220]|uniref:caspase family protein n=1 Tax=Aquibium sp. ELW1220 TaxID=2976766 RepID=UPI0025B27835|nr:caspase family protein [Aquibium sp. ELW1220]MDN2582994.1 caspase family protein [Aquibium sp. ELW1220]
MSLIFRLLLSMFLTAAVASTALADGACTLASDPATGADFVTAEAEEPVAGSDFVLTWERPLLEAGACEGAVWLVLATPNEARFSGDGFMALASGEPAPQELGFAADRMRLFIPLHAVDDDHGTITIGPFVIGSFEIDWALFHQSEAERAARISPIMIAEGRLDLEVEPGRPRVVVQDLFSTQTPLERIRSNSGRFILEVFDGHYRVNDALSGALIHAGYGNEPNFSPTSRFLHVLGQGIDLGLEVPVFDDLTVIDLFSEQVVLRTATPGRELLKSLHWSPGDSFLAISAATWGEIGFKEMLTDRSIVFHGVTFARQNTAEETGFVDIDPDAATARMGHGRLGEGLFAPPLKLSLVGQKNTQPFRSEADPSIPEGWRMDLGSANGRSWRHHAEWLDGPVRGDVVSHELLGDGVPRRDPFGDADRRGAVSLFRPRSGAQSDSRFVARMADVGIDVALVSDYRRSVLGAPGDDVSSLLRFDPAEPLVEAGFIEPQSADTVRFSFIDAYLTHDPNSLECWSSEVRSWAFASVGAVEQFIQILCIEGSASVKSGSLSRTRLIGGDAETEILVGTYMRDAGLVDMAGKSVTFDVSNEVQIFRLAGGLSAIVSRDGAMVVLEAERARVVGQIQREGFHDQIVLVSLTADRRHLVVAEINGRFQIFPTGGGDPVLEGRYLDDEIVIFDRDFQFDGTPEGARHAHLKFYGDRYLYTLDQFADRLRRPGLMPSRLTTSGEAANPSPGKAPFSVPLPPRIEHVGGGLGDAVYPGETELRVRVHARNGLRSIVLYRDGIAIEEREGDGEDLSELAFELKPLPETRSFALLATDSDGVRSQAWVESTSRPPGPRPSGRLVVVALGTDRYDDPAIPDLRYAVSDARSMVERLGTAKSPYYNSIETYLVADAVDLDGEIRNRLHTLVTDLSDRDTLFLHIAGHGVLGSDGQLYLAGRRSRFADLSGTAIAWREIVGILERSRGRVVVFLDVCHSGAAGGATNDVAVDDLALASGAPIVVLAASKGRQSSLEAARFGGGLFTSALLDVLVGERHGQQVPVVRDLFQTYSALKPHVVDVSGGKQTPWIARSGMVGLIPLF